MNTRYLSTYLCLLPFLSTVFLYFLVYKSFSFLVKFILNYFTLFDAMVNGNVSLFLFQIVCCSLFLYVDFVTCNFTELVYYL